MAKGYSGMRKFDHSRTTSKTKLGKSLDGKNHVVKIVGPIPGRRKR